MFRNGMLLAICMFAMTSFAYAGSIYTGAQGGAYNSTFCPPLPSVLEKSFFSGYRCTPSAGTIENIQKVLANPSNMGFAQLDVLALQMQQNPDLAKQISIIRTDIACEGLWMVTKNAALKTYGDVLGYARRIPFILPTKESGSYASFKYLQSIDPNGLGRATNIRNVQDAAAVINMVAASSENTVGFFVQFADPENANIKLMRQKGLTIIPVVSRDITKSKVKDQDLYQVESFNLKAGGLFTSSEDKVTACTPVAVITGSPESGKTPNDRDNQKDLIDAIQKVPSSALLPTEPRMAKLLTGIRHVSGAALDEMLAATDKAQTAVMKQLQ